MKNWLITGCSSGIGFGTAQAVLDTGMNVVACARRTEPMQPLALQFPQTCRIVSMDVTDPRSRAVAIDIAQKEFGDIDVLVNCAGSGYRAAIEEGPLTALEHLMEVNAYGPLELIKLVLPSMRKRRKGCIVDVTSIGGVRGAQGNGYYSASKAALEMIDDTLRLELADFGIKVITVEPGAFRTGFYSALGSADNVISDYDEAIAAMRIGNTAQPNNQNGDPAAAGRAIVKAALLADSPKRLALGSDAVRILKSEYENRLTEIKQWSDLSISTDFAN